MKKHLDRVVAFLQDNEGASSIEYALLVGLIAVVIVAAVSALGTKLAESYTTYTAKLP